MSSMKVLISGRFLQNTVKTESAIGRPEHLHSGAAQPSSVQRSLSDRERCSETCLLVSHLTLRQRWGLQLAGADLGHKLEKQPVVAQITRGMGNIAPSRLPGRGDTRIYSIHTYTHKNAVTQTWTDTSSHIQGVLYSIHTVHLNKVCMYNNITIINH